MKLILDTNKNHRQSPKTQRKSKAAVENKAPKLNILHNKAEMEKWKKVKRVEKEKRLQDKLRQVNEKLVS